MTPTEMHSTMKEEEIYLIDMWRLLLRQWRWFVATMAMALALSFAFVHLAQRQWEASAWIQIGEIGATPAGHDPKVEPFQRAIDRMKTRQFQDSVLESQSIPLQSHEAGLYRKSLKLDPDPYANLIRVDVRADSPEQARRLATATVNRLQAIHRDLGAAMIQLGRQRLHSVDQDIDQAVADRNRLQQSNVPDGAHGTGVAQPLLVAMLVGQKDEVIRQLRNEKADLLARLSPDLTYNTSQPWPVYVPDKPAFPNPLMAWGLGILCGGALGVLVAVTLEARRRRSIA